MSELKPACPNCRSLSTTFLGDVGKKNWSCDDCLCTWDQSRSAAQITPQAGEAEPAYYAVVDEEGDVIELTKDKQYAHDFINDAIASAMEQDITLANRWVVRPLYRTAPPRPACDGNHAAPACADPECWQRPSLVAPVWQPIESAPRDGDGFLACDDNYDCVEWLKWDGDLLFNVNSKNYTRPDVWKYWRPLPSPPDSPGAEEL